MKNSFAMLQKFLLDPNNFSVADGPTGFQCHFCKCVGHTYAKCERRLAVLEEKEEQQRKMNQMRLEHQAQMQYQQMMVGYTVVYLSDQCTIRQI